MMETIDFEKNLLTEKENELVNLMSKKEELAKEIEEDKSSLDGIIAELNAKKDTLNAKMQEVSEEQNELKSERESVAQDIDSNTMSKYDEIYKARKGLVVAEILDGSCEGVVPWFLHKVSTRHYLKISFFVVTAVDFYTN